MGKFIKLEQWSSSHPNIIKVILNYPSKRNCLSKAAMIELTQTINDINTVNAANVIILTHGMGHSKVFSSGHDLIEIYKNIQNKQELDRIFKICNTLMVTVTNSLIPIIGMVNGVCTAAGFELIVCCDLVLCSKQATFQTPGVHIGLFCHTPSVQLAKVMYSRKHSMQLLLTGDPINAATAHRMGFVNFVCDDVDQLSEKTLEIALKICSKSKSVIAFGKESFLQHSKEKNLKDAYKIASRNMVHNAMNFDDAKHGISAFLNKQKPKWTNKINSKM